MPKAPKAPKALASLKHPGSRKTMAVIKKTAKMKSRQKSKMISNLKQNLVGEKLMWFKNELCEDSQKLTAPEIAELIEKYLDRHSEELEQIKIKRSVGGKHRGRQHASREDALRMTTERETEEYETCGLEIPNLMNAQQVQLLLDWDGDLKQLPNFRLVRHTREQLETM